MATQDTADQSWGPGGQQPAAPQPGVVIVFSGGQPIFAPAALERGAIVLGRGPVGGALIEDATVSRRHARVAFDRGTWTVSDLDSRNGSAVDGAPLRGEWRGAPTVVRVGDTIALVCGDVAPMLGALVEVAGGVVIGPTLAATHRRVAAAARGGVVHLRGESGAGKELLARRFHAAGERAGGPFVAINCAAIPPTMAERLLFGTRKGAYSGAIEDADGMIQSADRGTLFLDEIADVDLQVQAKLLRVLETREVLPLGASRGRAVELGLCSASHRDLRAEVAAGRFRQDLYFRVATPEVVLPPLRERREEIPWLVTGALRELERRPHASLVEACLLRAWPGNVRELSAAVRAAAAAEPGDRVEGRHLAPTAGAAFAAEGAAAPGGAPDAAAIARALAEHGGNVSAAARALGVHRTQMRRLIDRHGLKGGDEGEGEGEGEST